MVKSDRLARIALNLSVTVKAIYLELSSRTPLEPFVLVNMELVVAIPKPLIMVAPGLCTGPYNLARRILQLLHVSHPMDNRVVLDRYRRPMGRVYQLEFAMQEGVSPTLLILTQRTVAQCILHSST